MFKHIVFAVLVAAALAVCFWLAWSTGAAPPAVVIGDDARAIGQLVEPVKARAMVYDANKEEPQLQDVRVTSGTWLVPDSSIPDPFGKECHE